MYHPFPDSNAVWVTQCGGLASFECACCAGSCEQFTTTEDSLGGDSIIGIYTYHKLYNWFMNSSYCNGPVDGSCNNNITSYFGKFVIGLIRQDTNTRKVYYRSSSSAHDTLLYDFNLFLGDTLPPTYINASNYAYVSRIDSFYMQGSYHKRFWLWLVGTTPPTSSDSGFTSIIEGMGNTSGLLQLGPTYYSEGGCFQYCIKINANVVYPNATGSCTSLKITGIMKERDTKIALNILPNPTKGIVNVELGTLNENTNLHITDMLGNMVKQIKVQNSQFTIDVSDLNEGIYNISIISNEGVVNKRIVIIR